MEELLKINEIKTITNAHMDLLLLADPSKKMILEYVNRGICFDIENGLKQPIGIIVLVPVRPQTIEIMNLSIHEGYQSKGYGRYLVQHAIQYAKSQQYSNIEVGTGNSSIGQIAFYQKCGFRITGIEQDFFSKHYKEKIIENGLWCRDMIRFSMQIKTTG